MENKYRRFYLEWWKIRQSTITGLIIFVLLATVIAFASWWAIKKEWLSNTESSELPVNAARIFSFEGDVRITRAATRETIVVTKPTYVTPGDTIQTQVDGRATVQMIDGSTYVVRPNSTVVIRDNSSIFGGQNVRVALDDGQLNVKTEEQPDNSRNVVEMLDSETRLKSQTDASFNADQRSGGGEIRIIRGSVETTVGDQTTTINEDEFAAVKSGSISAREKLLLPPRLVSPSNGDQIVDSLDTGVNVTFTWQPIGSDVTSYHIQVARSPYFAPSSVLADLSAVTSRDFRLTGLTPGNYYWRLKSTARSGQTSDWSEPGRFSVSRRISNPAIEVTEWKAERVGGNVYILSGRTQPGMLVRSQGREVYAGNDGLFRLQISTPLSEIAIEMGDDRGNHAGFVLSLKTARVIRRF